MSAPKFTNGPWNLGICEQASPYNTVQVPTIFVYGYTICTLNPKGKHDQNGNWRGFDEDLTEVNANAALIKMSPEMYILLADIKAKLDRSIRWSIAQYLRTGYSLETAKHFNRINIEFSGRIKRLLKKARGEE